MDAKDIISLAAAGFTKGQIVTIMEQLESKQPAIASNAVIVPPATMEHVYNPVQPQQPTVNEPAEPWDALIAELKGLRQEVINGNINNSQQPQAQQPTVDDILASIIAPPTKDTGGNNT